MRPEASAGLLYVALIHFPVYDKNRKTVRTSLTPMDLHDIARACRTYGVRGFYVVSPLASQRELAQTICDHWTEGYGARYNPNRKEAFALVRITADLDETFGSIQAESGFLPYTVATGARITEWDLDCAGFSRLLRQRDKKPFLILFGTGWGLLAETIQSADYRLAPIRGIGPYNHLSVRSAVSIFLDRIQGSWPQDPAGHRYPQDPQAPHDLQRRHGAAQTAPASRG